MGNKIFVTVINCADNEAQDAVTDFLKKEYKADEVDVIIETAPVRFLSDGLEDDLINYIKDKVRTSVDNYGSKLLALVAHDNCDGNQVSKEEQLSQMEKAMELLKEFSWDIEVRGLWVDEDENVTIVK